jgi:pimeloyl-ACP methyl ester carboxylesterase
METRFFEQPEGTIAYDDSRGDGQLVIIMWPGMGALRSEYRYLAPALIEAGYRVVTVDFDDYMEKLLANLRQPGRFEALKGLGFSPKTASEERIAQVQVLALVVMGTKDPDWPDPEAEAQWIVDQLSAELLLVEDAGHYPQTEMPDKVIPGILDFLAKVSQPEDPAGSYN